jgi:Domain of unknown function (DUF5666)
MRVTLGLRIEGARQNNLKNISLEIPHDRLTVITGVSGSGKSSLAFDTVFAEGHWRYMESLSTYARMFLERLDRPDVDRIERIRSAVALEQKNPTRTARSTVGTATEIADYLRVLYAKVGRLHCPRCGAPAAAHSAQSIVDNGRRQHKGPFSEVPVLGTRPWVAVGPPPPSTARTTELSRGFWAARSRLTGAQDRSRPQANGPRRPRSLDGAHASIGAAWLLSRAATSGGARSSRCPDNPRAARIARMASGSSMVATKRRRAPPRGRASTSMSNARLMRSAHAQCRGCRAGVVSVAAGGGLGGAQAEGEVIVKDNQKARLGRNAWLSALLMSLSMGPSPQRPPRLERFMENSSGRSMSQGGSLTLPLAPGSPGVTITLFLGGTGGPAVPIMVTPNTKVEAEDDKEEVSESITLIDGDLIEVRGKLQNGQIVATKIELQEFPEIKVFGSVDVPGTSLTLPLAPGSPGVTITLFLGGTGGPAVPIIVTPSTRVRGGTTLTLHDNDFIAAKTLLRSGQIVAVKIGTQNEDEVEDDDDDDDDDDD